MTIAARTANVPKYDPDRRLQVARLHAQVKAGKTAAALAAYDYPRMPCIYCRSNLGPKPNWSLSRHFRVEPTHNGQ